MELKYDEQADAVYISFIDKPYAYGKDLDDERRVDYASDNVPIGIELLCVSDGVNLDGLPRADEVSAILKAQGIRTYRMVKYSYPISGSSSVLFDVELGWPETEAQGRHTVSFKEEVTV